MTEALTWKNIFERERDHFLHQKSSLCFSHVLSFFLSILPFLTHNISLPSPNSFVRYCPSSSITETGCQIARRFTAAITRAVSQFATNLPFARHAVDLSLSCTHSSKHANRSPTYRFPNGLPNRRQVLQLQVYSWKCSYTERSHATIVRPQGVPRHFHATTLRTRPKRDPALGCHLGW